MKPDVAGRLLAQEGAGIADLAPLTDRPFRDPLIAEICRRMEDSAFAGGAIGARALSLVIGLLLASARKRISHASRGGLSERGFADVVRHIDGALDQTLTVEGLARVAGMPARTFSMAFREASGLPVYQYVLRRRAERARDLLTSTDLGLSAIAHQTGFAHQAHMTRVVKRLLGRTPAQIRNGDC